MLASQTRGKSASGMAYLNAKNEVMIRKQAGPAEYLVKGLSEDQWNEVAQSPRALFHARATTKGTEKDNENNHPVSAYGWVVVHNGHINNDDELFSHYKAERYAAVDTACVPLVLKQGKDYDDSLRQLSLLAGQASVAVWSLEQPDKIALARLGSNDVYVFYDPVHQITYWCSTPTGGRAIPGFRLGNLAFFTVAKLHENKVLILEPTAEKARLLKIDRQPFLPPRVWVAQDFHRNTPAKVTEITGSVITNSETGTIIVTPNTGGDKVRSWTKDATRREFEWWSPNPLQKKPAIDLASVQNTWFDWGQVRDYFLNAHKKTGPVRSVWTMPTAYGRWIFDCPDTSHPETFGTVFLPAKRVKKHFRRNYADEIPDSKLPTTNLGELDQKMTLENFVFVEKFAAGIRHIMGNMCPWCGITQTTHAWSRLDFRCPGCGIVSRPYVNGGA